MMDSLLIGKGERPCELLLKLANRHGLIAGATGTGKTVTLQGLAEGFSAAGVPVFLADVKGDLAGISQIGVPKSFLEDRAEKMGLSDYRHEAFPVMFWDLAGAAGSPIRATISEMGPVLLSRLLELNDTQEGVLNIAFKVADEQGLLLLDFKDLTALLQYVADHAADLTGRFGNVSKASVGAIQRALLTLANQGADHFFGEPALDLADLMQVDGQGRGYVNILAADKLIQTPRLYSTFLLWLLSELFEQLPEIGDPEKPKLVFFFDEAHLLFNNAPRALLEKITQVVRLIRSKGVGVYFVTQNPLDLPEEVLGQLGNRVQHALRAFTPKDQKAVKTAAETFRANPAFDTAEVITQLGVGEALVSMLDAKGAPQPVERALICPPRARLGVIADQERNLVLADSPVLGKYEEPIDRESAFERLATKAQTVTSAPPQTQGASQQAEAGPGLGGILFGDGRRQGVAEVLVKSVVRAASSQVGQQIGKALIRGLLGSFSRR